MIKGGANNLSFTDGKTECGRNGTTQLSQPLTEPPGTHLLGPGHILFPFRFSRPSFFKEILFIYLLI